jgi:hypothetical protein
MGKFLEDGKLERRSDQDGRLSDTPGDIARQGKSASWLVMRHWAFRAMPFGIMVPGLCEWRIFGR